MNVYLKVKIKSLAEEARIIRHEEVKRRASNFKKLHADIQQQADSERSSLHLHRTIDVRVETRAALLAYGFLRGRKYSQVETPPKKPTGKEIPLKRVVRLISKYGDIKEKDAKTKLENWLT